MVAYYIKSQDLYHHGILGMKWGIRRYQPYPKGKKGRFVGNPTLNKMTSISEIKDVANRIKKEVEKHENGGPSGNQNCQLCTWCMEAQFRGKEVVPRPVYSPRDVTLQMNGYDIVKNPEKIGIKGKNDVVNTLKTAGDGSRFYMHVNWKGRSSGHEFIVANIGNEAYVIDGQDGTVEKTSSSKAKTYFEDVNYDNSYLVRMDNKPLNSEILKYNDTKYLTKWDEKKEIEFMKKNGFFDSSEDELKHGLDNIIEKIGREYLIENFERLKEVLL